MSYSQVDLEGKIRGLYPEIKEHNIEFSMDFDDEEVAWIIKLKKGLHELTTHFAKEDADECMEGMDKVHMCVQIGEFFDNFKREE